MDISNAEYHAAEGISSSVLKEAARSLAHCYARYFDPAREKKTTPAMDFGTCVHTMVLEPLSQHQVFAVVPEGMDRRSKEGKAFFADIEDAGLIALKQTDFEKIEKITKSVFSNTKAKELINHDLSIIEQSFFVDCSLHGLKLKARPDIFIPPCKDFPSGAICDLKTTLDASQGGFERSAYNLGYHIQAGWYAYVISSALKLNEIPDFYFISVEKEAPYACTVFKASKYFIYSGIKKAIALYDEVAIAIRDDYWPAYTEKGEVADLDLPRYAEESYEDGIEVSYE